MPSPVDAHLLLLIPVPDRHPPGGGEWYAPYPKYPPNSTLLLQACRIARGGMYPAQADRFINHPHNPDPSLPHFPFL
jgi:hypothetical protein